MMILSIINDHNLSMAQDLKNEILSIDNNTLVDIQSTEDDLSIGWHSVVICLLPPDTNTTVPMIYYRNGSDDIGNLVALEDYLIDTKGLQCECEKEYTDYKVIPKKVWNIHSDAEILPSLVVAVRFPQNYQYMHTFAEALLECEALNQPLLGLFIQRPDGNWWYNRSKAPGLALKYGDINNIRGLLVYVNTDGIIEANKSIDTVVNDYKVRLFFDESGEMRIGWVFEDGYWYKFDPLVATYACINTIVNIDGERYFTDELGRLMVPLEEQVKFYVDDDRILHKKE